MKFAELHQVMGHAGLYVKRMIRQKYFSRLNVTNINDPFDCVHCQMYGLTAPHDTVAYQES